MEGGKNPDGFDMTARGRRGGRRPTPSHLKLVKARPAKTKPGQRQRNEPKPKREIPSPPAHLSDRAKVAWGQLSVILDRMGVLTEADPIGLEGAVEAYADYLDARATLKALDTPEKKGKKPIGRYIKGRGGWKPHPAMVELRDADRRLRAWLQEFGLTPSARTRLDVDPDARDEDPANKFFG